LVQSIINSDITTYVDWATGTAYFDTSSFIELLEFAYDYNERVQKIKDEVSRHGEYSRHPFELIMSGEQLIYNVGFQNFSDYSLYQHVFGGDFVFKGYPAASGSGNNLYMRSGLAISALSDEQQGAWEFVQFFLSERWQSRLYQDMLIMHQEREYDFDIPTNKNVFNQLLEKAMRESPPSRSGGFLEDIGLLRPLTQEEVDKIMDLINSVSTDSSYDLSLNTILGETLNDFFNGMISAQDTARVIQNRTSRYVAEQR